MIQWVALFVFTSMMCQQIPPLIRTFVLIWIDGIVVKDVSEDKPKPSPLTVTPQTRLILTFLAPLAELTMLILFFICGIIFIFQSASNEEVSGVV